MIEYVAELQTVPAARTAETTGQNSTVSFETLPSSDVLGQQLDLDFSIPVSYLDGEWVVVALAEGHPVGRALVSVDQRPYVKPLGRQLQFDGAYVRRVYVHPDWRNHGIASTLIPLSIDVAKTQFDADKAYAMIAPDNKPSRLAFEAYGFEPIRRHDYVSLFGRESRRETEL